MYNYYPNPPLNNPNSFNYNFTPSAPLIDQQQTNNQHNTIHDNLKDNISYIIFNKYGRNIIKQEEFEELYLVIFNVYTYFPYDNDFRGYFCNCR